MTRFKQIYLVAKDLRWLRKIKMVKENGMTCQGNQGKRGEEGKPGLS